MSFSFTQPTRQWVVSQDTVEKGRYADTREAVAIAAKLKEANPDSTVEYWLDHRTVVSVIEDALTVPTITGLTATPSSIYEGETVTINATTTGASSYTINGQPGTLPYALTLPTAGTITITVTATNLSGTTTATTTVTVNTFTPVTELQNVARWGSATASSTFSAGFPASAVLNGDRTGTGWSAGGGWNDGTEDTFPDSIVVQLDASYPVEKISIFTLQDNPSSPITPTESTTCLQYGIKDFTVEYWDGAAYQVVTGGTVTNNTLVWRDFTFTPVTTDKIRVTVTAINNGAADQVFSRIVEIEVWAQTDTIHELPQDVYPQEFAPHSNWAAAEILKPNCILAYNLDGTDAALSSPNPAILDRSQLHLGYPDSRTHRYGVYSPDPSSTSQCHPYFANGWMLFDFTQGVRGIDSVFINFPANKDPAVMAAASCGVGDKLTVEYDMFRNQEMWETVFEGVIGGSKLGMVDPPYEESSSLWKIVDQYSGHKGYANIPRFYGYDPNWNTINWYDGEIQNRWDGSINPVCQMADVQASNGSAPVTGCVTTRPNETERRRIIYEPQAETNAQGQRKINVTASITSHKDGVERFTHKYFFYANWHPYGIGQQWLTPYVTGISSTQAFKFCRIGYRRLSVFLEKAGTVDPDPPPVPDGVPAISRPSWMTGMTPKVWNEIPNTAPSSFLIHASWDATRTKTWNRNRFQSYGGGAKDELLQEFHVGFNDGHSEQTQDNGTYKFRYNRTTPDWVRVHDAFDWTTVGFDYNPAGSKYFPDGTPMPPHAYDMLHIINPVGAMTQKHMICLAGAASTYFSGTLKQADILKLDSAGLSTGWVLNGLNVVDYPYDYSLVPPFTSAKDPRNQRVYSIGPAGVFQYKIPGLTEGYFYLSNLPGGWAYQGHGSCIDVDRDLMVVGWAPDNGGVPALKRVNLNTLTHDNLVLQPATAAADCVHRDFNASMVHSRRHDKYYLIGKPITPYTARLLEIAPGTGVTTHIVDKAFPTATPTQGDLTGRLWHDEQLDCLFLCLEYSANVLCMPLS